MSGVLRWEEPPDQPENSRRIRRTVADDLRDKPGAWAVIRECSTDQAARNVAHRTRNGFTVPFRPARSFEATVRFVDGKHLVYARYVGEPSPEVKR